MLPEPAIQWLGPAQPLLDGQTRDELVAQGLKHKALALSGVVECSSGSPEVVLPSFNRTPRRVDGRA